MAVAWAVLLVLGVAWLTHAGGPDALPPELVLIVIFVSLGLLAIAGMLLCRCPHCGALLWVTRLPKLGPAGMDRCPACRAGLMDSVRPAPGGPDPDADRPPPSG